MNIRTVLASAFLAAGLGFAGTANAFPVGAAATAGLNDNVQVQDVAYRCGRGWTRGPYGHCRPRFTCPRGWHSGPRGFHCFRNRW